MQHDECRVCIAFLGLKFKWREKSRKIVSNAIWQPSVQVFDEDKPYRPETLAEHVDSSEFYEPS